MAKDKKQPEAKFRSGSVTATIWMQKVKKDKKEMTFYSTRIEKSYKDEEDEWQTTSSFNTSELGSVILVTQRAQEWIMDKIQESYNDKAEVDDDEE